MKEVESSGFLTPVHTAPGKPQISDKLVRILWLVGEEGQKTHGAGGEGKLRSSKNLCGRIRFFQPLRFWQRYLEGVKLPRTALITFNLGLAEPGILKTCGKELGDLKKCV